MTRITRLVVTALLAAGASAHAQAPPPQGAAPDVLFRNVRVFDGHGASLSAPTSVLVRGNTITAIGASLPSESATVIDGHGGTLMPGLIDAHVHLMMTGLSQVALLTSDIGLVNLVAARQATAMLLRGYTSARDMGGPAFGLKRAIDMGIVDGPRIWPSGAMISQSGGHGDFRLPNDLPAPPDSFTYSERVNASAIADAPGAVRKRARAQLARGASQIKLMAGGGASSAYDPIDVTQYTTEELHAGVEAAENWNTYVAVHAYTPRAIRQAIDAGVKCIEHGQLADEATAKLIAEKGVWWSLQPFTEDRPSAFPEGSPSRLKQRQIFAGTDTAYQLAKKYHIKTAWGTDLLFDPVNATQQTRLLTSLVRWYSPAEILRMATSGNGELLQLSGPRSPYPGRLGVVEAGALADLLLVNGDPLADIKVLENADANLLVVMKNGKIYKNIVH